MKRNVILIILSLVVLIIAWIIFYTYPRHVSLSVNGVEYHVGVGTQEVTPVKLVIEGTLKKSLNGTKKFDGTINIIGATIKNADNNRQAEIKFRKDGYGSITYFYLKDEKPMIDQYGIIFESGRFSKITICEFQPGKRRHTKGWGAANGWVMSAPAKTRAEAVQLSNRLMKQYLRGYVLQ